MEGSPQSMYLRNWGSLSAVILGIKPHLGKLGLNFENYIIVVVLRKTQRFKFILVCQGVSIDTASSKLLSNIYIYIYKNLKKSEYK